MSPKGTFENMNDAVGATGPKRFKMEKSHLTALGIFIVIVAWMLSGQLTGEDAPVAAVPPADGAAETVSGENKDTPLTRVRVAVSHSEEHVRTIAILGRTEADRAVSVRAEVPGRVSKVTSIKGSLVEAGDVLVELDPENLPALLAEARARLKQREIAYESAKKLSKGGYSSRLNVAQSKADLEAARAQVAGMQRDLNNTTITAPIAGVLDSLPLEQGDFIDKAGQVAARIIDLTSVVVVGEVAERDIGKIDLGGIASVRLPDGRRFDGQVSYVAKSSNALTRTFAVEVTIPVPDMSVPEGVTAELHLPMERVEAHKITPALLTLNDDGAIGVKTVNDDGVVEFHPVRMVSDTEDGIWLTGLPDGVRIITVGQEFVIAGERVEAVEGDLATMSTKKGN